MAKRTHLPEKIVALLKAEPTLTRKEIASKLSVSYQAVQKHLNELMKEPGPSIKNSFTVTGVIGVTHRKFWITINTKYNTSKKGTSNNYQDQLCEEIHSLFRNADAKAKELIFDDIRIVLGGRFDIVLTLYSNNPDAVGRFVTRYLRSRPSVAETSTAWSLEREAEPSGGAE